MRLFQSRPVTQVAHCEVVSKVKLEAESLVHVASSLGMRHAP